MTITPRDLSSVETPLRNAIDRAIEVYEDADYSNEEIVLRITEFVEDALPSRVPYVSGGPKPKTRR